MALCLMYIEKITPFLEFLYKDHENQCMKNTPGLLVKDSVMGP